LNWWK